MIVYVDTSVVLRVVLGQQRALGGFADWEGAFSSELLGLEARRVLDRLRLEAALDDEGLARAHEQIAKVERAVARVRLTRLVLRRASLPMPTAVKTVDAIHLASALLLSERRGLDLVFATHDVQQAVAARALGFACIGV